MDSLSAAFSALFPVFSFLALGYALRKRGMVDDAFLRRLNSLIFHVLLSTLLFCNIYTARVDGGSTARLLAFGVLVNVGVFLILLVLVPLFEKENRRRGVMIQGIFRGNFLLLGLPILESLYGGKNLDHASVLIAVIVPLYNVLCAAALEIFRGETIRAGKILRELVRNPLLIAAALALALRLTGVRLPGLVVDTLQQFSGIATPLALLVLGGTFRFSQLRDSGPRMAICLAGKLIVFPGAVVGLAVFLGFRGPDLGALLVMSASSTAVSSFSMAQEAGADGILAGQIVVGTTLFSIFTLFLWIFGLKQMALI